MELWLILILAAHLVASVSTSLDKYMMNKGFNLFRTGTLKMFFDGIILLTLGVLFLNLDFSTTPMIFAAIIGGIYGANNFFYYKSLKMEDIEDAMPFFSAGSILLVFILSTILFKEASTSINYIGLVFILVGLYIVISKNGISIPKLNRGFLMVAVVVIIGSVHALLSKKFLLNINPINLVVMMYFFATLTMALMQFLFDRESLKYMIKPNKNLAILILGAVFGSISVFLYFSALAIGEASKVYAVGAIQVVFVFIIASLFLKEKFYIHRLLGTIVVVAGIYFVAI